MKKVNIIWSHPRQESLTGNIVSDVKEALAAEGFSIHETDLYRSGFSPVLLQEDEPDFSNPDKRYSETVMKMAAELDPDTPLVIVFPVWWYTLPAMLKGYLDRVWNFGLIYGEGRRVPASKVIWVGMVGMDEHSFSKRGFDENLKNILNVGMAGYCCIPQSHVELVYNTLGDNIVSAEAHYTGLKNQAVNAVSDFLRD
ncbi:NAD(P)H oxidoreductase [Enterobacter hormaechei subsp. oharae]